MKMPFGLWTQVDPRKHVLDVTQILHAKRQWGKDMLRHAQQRFAVSCTKMAELINLPFGLWTRVGRRKHKFNRVRHTPSHGGSEPLFNTCFLGPVRGHNPNSISIGSAVFAGLTTVTDRPTDHTTRSVTIGRLCVHSTTMQPEK